MKFQRRKWFAAARRQKLISPDNEKRFPRFRKASDYGRAGRRRCYWDEVQMMGAVAARFSFL